MLRGTAPRCGVLGLRAAGYGALLLIASRSTVAMNALAGVFVADVALRVMDALEELRHDRFALLAEVLVLGAMWHLWSSLGGGALPADLEGRALAMLGFLLAFALRLGVFVHRLLHGD
jgi:hypothetical protein